METLTNGFVAEAERLADERGAGDPAWLVRARRAALDRFAALGLPTTRDEEWRFTSVAPIAETRFALPRDGAGGIGPEDVGAFQWAGERTATLVFVNGHYAAHLSTPGREGRGVVIDTLAASVARGAADVERQFGRGVGSGGHAFTALNTAFAADGAMVAVPDGVVVDAPIHLLFLSTGRETMAHPRVLIDMGANSQATVVETYRALGAERSLTNAVTEIAAGEGAVLQHYRVQAEADTAFHVGGIYARAAKSASLACWSIGLGGALTRNDVVAVLDGEGASCTLNGVYVVDGTRVADNHTAIDHAQPHCSSREVYKGVLDGRSRAVFNGKIIVRPDAQKTDAKQTNRALLLSEDARINTKPQLEIFANDVKCTHGAAVGQVDDEAIFYLRARGLDERQARRLLIRAFAGDVLGQIPLEPLRAHFERAFASRLPEPQP
jgi:Fe-S cluster assembly protein SufD